MLTGRRTAYPCACEAACTLVPCCDMWRPLFGRSASENGVFKVLGACMCAGSRAGRSACIAGPLRGSGALPDQA